VGHSRQKANDPCGKVKCAIDIDGASFLSDESLHHDRSAKVELRHRALHTFIGSASTSSWPTSALLCVDTQAEEIETGCDWDRTIS